MLRIPFDEMKSQIKRAMLNAGLSDEQAEICATTHAESSRDGVYSHGLNRVARFIDFVKKGWVNLEGKPVLVGGMGSMENYDGQLGIGIINAKLMANRAIELAKSHGIGVIGLKNTTHWMRGGTYAWGAADSGFLMMCWTNTESCMPAWGATEPCLGNNPFCIAIPSKDGNVVLDMAMSQYSYGKLQVTRLSGEKLPYPGGFDVNGNLTHDPGEIEESRRILPTGLWKGSGLAIVLDLAAAIMSNGLPTCDIDDVGKGSCGGCSQIFIAVNPHCFGSEKDVNNMIERTKQHIANAKPLDGQSASYPGERTLKTRQESMKKGIIVDKKVWEEVCGLQA